MAELPISDFYANNRAKDGLGTYCKECSKSISVEYARKRRARKKEEAKKFCRYVLVSYSDDLIETSIEIIEALIEKGYFNKEYLEE